MFVVPIEERSEFSAKLLSPPRHDRRPTEEIGLKREDEALDDRNAAMLTDGAVAGLDVLVVAPFPKTVVVELRAAVADQIFWFGADGQVLLLPDADQLLVLSESGEAVLLRTNPEKLDELARHKVLEGKTWNHPALVGNRLYSRNGEEMSCFELPVTTVAGK